MRVRTVLRQHGRTERTPFLLKNDKKTKGKLQTQTYTDNNILLLFANRHNININRYHVRNENIRGTTRVVQAFKKIIEKRLNRGT